MTAIKTPRWKEDWAQAALAGGVRPTAVARRLRLSGSVVTRLQSERRAALPRPVPTPAFPPVILLAGTHANAMARSRANPGTVYVLALPERDTEPVQQQARWAVLRAGRCVWLGMTRGRLAAILLARRGTPVCVEDLVDALWGDHPDGGPLNHFQCLSQAAMHLRKVLGPLGLSVPIRVMGSNGPRCIHAAREPVPESKHPSTFHTIGIGGYRVHFMQPPWFGIEFSKIAVKLQPNQYGVVHRLASTWPKGVDEAALLRSVWGAPPRERGRDGLYDADSDVPCEPLPKVQNGFPDDPRIALIKLVNRINDLFEARGVPIRIEAVRPPDVVGARYYRMTLTPELKPEGVRS